LIGRTADAFAALGWPMLRLLAQLVEIDAVMKR